MFRGKFERQFKRRNESKMNGSSGAAALTPNIAVKRAQNVRCADPVTDR
jgi:hypothetical protein